MLSAERCQKNCCCFLNDVQCWGLLPLQSSERAHPVHIRCCCRGVKMQLLYGVACAGLMPLHRQPKGTASAAVPAAHTTRRQGIATWGESSRDKRPAAVASTLQLWTARAHMNRRWPPAELRDMHCLQVWRPAAQFCGIPRGNIRTQMQMQ
jgi:hypothetical protein